MVLGFAKLSSGCMIPTFGLGTWKSGKGEVKAAVEYAIRAGYRHIDCAAAYENEEEVGAALKTVLTEGVVERKDLFVTSKLWNSQHGNVENAAKKTLSDLGLDYLDLYLIHWPCVTGCKGPVLEPSIKATWTDMEALVDAGLVKSIGISNFSIKKMEDLLSYARIPPAVNQVELHPYWQQTKLLEYAASKNIHVTAYSPLGSPDSALGKAAPQVLQNEAVLQVAKKLGRTPGQVLLRWGIQRGTSVIPKSVTPARISENLGALEFELSSEDMAAVSAIGPQQRFVHGRFFCDPEGPYKTTADLWDGEE